MFEKNQEPKLPSPDSALVDLHEAELALVGGGIGETTL